jgi:hypothetical protein
MDDVVRLHVTTGHLAVRMGESPFFTDSLTAPTDGVAKAMADMYGKNAPMADELVSWPEALAPCHSPVTC